MEELDTGDDTDTQGVGLSSSRSSRFVSDPLNFTGIDLGEGMSRPRRDYAYGHSDDDVTSQDDSDQDSEEDSDNAAQVTLRGKEEALVESALARIRRAQVKGKEEVRLNKEELAALERRRKRMQAEAARGSGSSGSERRKRKEAEQRFAVPISHLDPTSRKKRPTSLHPDDALPRHPSPEAANDSQERLPPMGFFPPPSASRSRPRSATSSSQRLPSRGAGAEAGSSPFRYSYVQAAPPSTRHVSDTAARPQSARGPHYHEGSWFPNPNAAVSAPSVTSSRQQAALDPFRYMTAGSPAPYHETGAAPSRRHVSGPPGNAEYVNVPRGAVPAAVRGGRSSRRVSPDDTSEEASEDDETTSDERDQGARVRNSSDSRNREEIVVVEREPTPSPERPRKKSSSGSSPKKKQVALTSSRKKKGR